MARETATSTSRTTRLRRANILEERARSPRDRSMPSSHAAAAVPQSSSARLIAGKAPIEPKTALPVRVRCFGVDASIWLGIESDYRLHEARQAEARAAEESAAWADSFPIREFDQIETLSRSQHRRRTQCRRCCLNFGVASDRGAGGKKYHVSERRLPALPKLPESDEVLALVIVAEARPRRRLEVQPCASYSEPAF